MSYHEQFRQYLEAADVEGVRRLWHHVRPGMPQPKNDDEALIQIHIARTVMDTVPFKLRAYSHAWLMDHALPSLLPDELKPRAQRIYPVIAEAVGVASFTRNPMLKPMTKRIQGAMVDAVEEAHADGRLSDTAHVSARMREAADKQRKFFADLIQDAKNH